MQLLTAGHCVVRYQIEWAFKIVIVTNLEEIPTSPLNPKELAHPWYEVEAINIHKDYIDRDRMSNIAIITIKPGEEYDDMARINPPILEISGFGKNLNLVVPEC